MEEIRSDSRRRFLFEEWLRYFGVENAVDLDLGALAMIARFVDNSSDPHSSDAPNREELAHAAHHGIDAL